MKQTMQQGWEANTEAFSIATQIYVRLRRVTGRVVDAMYLAENPAYAQHVRALALATQDAELMRYVQRLADLMTASTESSSDPVPASPVEFSTTEATAEEIYQAQVSHHYIGALR